MNCIAIDLATFHKLYKQSNMFTLREFKVWVSNQKGRLEFGNPNFLDQEVVYGYAYIIFSNFKDQTMFAVKWL